MLILISPFRIWLNSCAITPCNWSRFSLVAHPRVTPMTASLGEYPAAKALIPSSSIRYTGGTGVPNAIAISSTTLRTWRESGSFVLWFSFFPPIASATTFPPCDSQLIRITLAINTAIIVPTMENTANSKDQAITARSFSNPTANEAKQKTEMMMQTTARPNNRKRYPVFFLALSCCSKKSMLYGSSSRSN